MKDRRSEETGKAPEPERTTTTDTKTEDNGASEEQTPEFLMKTLENVRKERDEYYDLLLRKQAEFENYRKRTLKDREEARLSALADIARELLAVLDAAEKGLATLQVDSDDLRLDGYRQGYELLLRQLQATLEKFGVKELSSVGARFDPSIHEAINTEATDRHEEGSVVEEYRKGYMISDRLLRPAQVKVAVPGPDSSE